MTTSTFTTSDGAKLSYTVLGPSSPSALKSKVPLVLIMGMSGVQQDWAPFSDELAKTRKVLVFDHRGIGGSYTPEDWDYDLSLAMMARDCIAIVTSLGSEWRTVDMLGWSMGGHILQQLLVLPEAKPADAKQGGGVQLGEVRVRKAVLAATMAKLPRGDFHPSVVEEAGAKAAPSERKVAMVRALMEFQYFPEWLAASAANREVLESRVKVSLATRRPNDIIGLQVGAIGAADLRQDLSRVPSSLPVLSLHGTRDRMVAISERDAIKKGIPHLEILPLPEEVGHFFFDYCGGGAWWAERVGKWLDEGKVLDAKAKL